MRAFRTLVLAVLLAPAALAIAPTAHAASIDEVKGQIKADKKTLKDDKKDLNAIRKIRVKWEKARAKGSSPAEARADVDLAEWMKAKLAEGREEIEAAADEAGVEAPTTFDKPHSSGGDTYSKPAAHPAPAPAKSDDMEDLDAEKTSQRRLREIADSLKETQGTFSAGRAGPELYDAKSKMLEEVQKIAAREVGRSERELTEDKAQLDRLKGN